MNSRRQFMATGLAGVVSGWAWSLSPATCAESRHDPPRALLLGDSISLGYTGFVTGILLGEVQVCRPLNNAGFYLNCEGTSKARKDLQAWLGDGNWDVIHFNFGLHDLKHVDPITGRNSRKPQDPLQATPAQYAENLEWIVEQLAATEAQLVFATTTPYPENPGGPLRDAGMSAKYNEIALPIMHRNQIEINDLYEFVLPRMEELFPPRNVHLKPAGSLELAKRVVEYIQQALIARNDS